MVFVDEQQVPKALEVDEDEAAAIHFVLYEEDQPLATLRLLPLSPSQVKLQRMAVQQDARQKSLGKRLILFAENYANEQGYQTITLGAQQTAIPFYEKIGYQPQGEPFMDNWYSPHHDAQNDLTQIFFMDKNQKDWTIWSSLFPIFVTIACSARTIYRCILGKMGLFHY